MKSSIHIASRNDYVFLFCGARCEGRYLHRVCECALFCESNMLHVQFQVLSRICIDISVFGEI